MTTNSRKASALVKGKAAVCSVLALAMLYTVAPALAQTEGGTEPPHTTESLVAEGGTASEVGVAKSGEFAGNPDLHWALGSDGTLAVTGSGVATETDEIFTIEGQIKGIFIGREVTELGEEVFSCLPLLEYVVFEEGSELAAIGAGAFRSCSSLSSICIPASVESIADGAFSSCFELQKVEFEADSALRSIGGSAFSSCTQLGSIALPSGVEQIGDYAFSGCSSLESLNVPAGVETLGESAFAGCAALEGLVVENPAATSVPQSALAGTPLELPNPSFELKGVKAAGKRALKVTWGKSQGATSYKVFYKKKGAKAFRQLKVKGAATTSATVRKLSSGKRYEVYVAAYKGGKLLWKCTGQVSPKVK